LCLYTLDDNRLTGTLPRSLFELPKLSTLNLGKLLMDRKYKNEQNSNFLLTKIASCLYITGWNLLEGTLPSEIGNSKALTVLDLREFMQSMFFVSKASLNFFFFLVVHK